MGNVTNTNVILYTTSFCPRLRSRSLINYDVSYNIVQFHQTSIQSYIPNKHNTHTKTHHKLHVYNISRIPFHTCSLSYPNEMFLFYQYTLSFPWEWSQNNWPRQIKFSHFHSIGRGSRLYPVQGIQQSTNKRINTTGANLFSRVTCNGSTFTKSIV